MQLTLVVDGVAQTKDASDEPDEGSTRRVLAVEETRLDAPGGRRSGALGELGVEVDKRAKACSRARGLDEISR